MTYSELNEFIKNYLENDNTGRAIMLNGTWGSGKSYYIKNILKPYLKSNKGGNHKCAIVSLYGLNEISEISKSIYIELRTIGKTRKSEVISSAEVAGKIIAKTILNGIVSKVGFEIGQSDKEFKDIYDSIDLSEKLIIFEDVERSSVDLIEFMGFVNNLTEQDGVKVLLVANENELIKDVNSENEKTYTTETTNYLKAKEKTVGDTINFQCNFEESIRSIYNNFPNDIFQDYSDAESINYILKNVLQKKDVNFRLVIFACQKITDILKYIQKHNINLNKDFKNCIVYSIFAYTHSTAYKDKATWDFQHFSQLYGTKDNPLPKFAYKYIIQQILEKEEIEACQQEFFKFKRFRRDDIKSPTEFSVIYECEIHTEIEIKHALNEINTILKNENQITSFYELGKLPSHLVFIGCELKIKEAYECIKNLINVFKGQNDLDTEYLFVNERILEGNSKEVYEKVKAQIIKSMNSLQITKLNIKYTIEWISMFFSSSEIYTKNWVYVISNLDIARFSTIITNVHPKLLLQIRNAFKRIYKDPLEFENQTRAYTTKEISNLQILKNFLNYYKNEINDNIVKFHTESFIKELSEI